MIQFIVSIAKEAAEIAQRFHAETGIATKTKSQAFDLVTEADLEVERFVVSRIKEKFPDHKIVAEESYHIDLKNPTGPLWIVDPIDGTTNFSRGLHAWAISIAYFEGSEAKAGVVFAPVIKELFTAERGKGAYLNGAPIHARRGVKLDSALVATGFLYRAGASDKIFTRFSRLLQSCGDLRRIGAASLDMCWTACGRLDGFYEDVKPWDMAAAALIAREAGCTVGHFVPPTIPAEMCGDEILVAAPEIYEELLTLLDTAKNEEPNRH